MKLVGNVIEVKGSGILLLGSGKTSLSILLAKMFKDTYLIADDYCTICGSLVTSIPNIGARKFVPASQWVREPLGKVRNSINMTFEPDIIERLGIGPDDDIRLNTRYIDTICNRIAHKHICDINYIVFLIQTPYTKQMILDFIYNYFGDIEDIARITNEIFNIFNEFDVIKNKYLLKKNHIIEISPSLDIFDIVIKFINSKLLTPIPHIVDFIKANELKVLLGFTYDDIIQKAIDMYEIIESRDSIYKYLPIKEEYIRDPLEII